MKRDVGFTFVEMCVAMCVLSMVAMAIVAFASVTAKTWRETENIQQLQVSAQQASGMLNTTVESSRALARVSHNPGSLFLWLKDAHDGQADGKAQFAEMGLIEYDPVLKTIFLYQANWSVASNRGGDAATVLTTAGMNNADYPAYFKTRRAWIDAPRALLGPGRQVDPDVTVTRVESVAFTPITSGDLPAVEMNATLSRGDQRTRLRTILIVRAPTARPDYAPAGN